VIGQEAEGALTEGGRSFARGEYPKIHAYLIQCRWKEEQFLYFSIYIRLYTRFASKKKEKKRKKKKKVTDFLEPSRK